MFSTWPYILILRLVFIFTNNNGISCSICIRKLHRSKDSSFEFLNNQKSMIMTFTIFFNLCFNVLCLFFHNQTVFCSFCIFFSLFWVTLKSSDIPLLKGRCTLVPSLTNKSCRKSAKRRSRALFSLCCSYAHFFVSNLRANDISKKKNQGAWEHLAANKGYLPLHYSVGLMIAMKTVLMTAKVQRPVGLLFPHCFLHHVKVAHCLFGLPGH